MSDVTYLEAVTRGHERTSAVFSSLLGRAVEVAEPFCKLCGEPWEADGCPTVRAVSQLRRLTRDHHALTIECGELRSQLVHLGSRVEAQFLARTDLIEVKVRAVRPLFTEARDKKLVADHLAARVRDHLHQWCRETFPPLEGTP